MDLLCPKSEEAMISNTDTWIHQVSQYYHFVWRKALLSVCKSLYQLPSRNKLFAYQ